MSSIGKLRNFIRENQIMVVFLGIVLGLLFPLVFRDLNRFATPLLITVFFCSSLHLSLDEVFEYMKDWRMLVIVALYMLIVMPFALFIPLSFFSNDWALAVLIIGAVPTGMTIALVADYFHGKSSLALVITAMTSLLAPLTIPLVFKIAIGARVDIPVVHMFWSLCLTIVAPFVLAMLVKRGTPKLVQRHETFFHETSILAFGALVTGIVADSSGAQSITVSWQNIGYLTIALFLMGVLTLVSYDIVPWRTNGERITIALTMVYVNNTLALFLADKFFRDQHILTPLILILLAINLLLPPIRFFAKRVAEHT